MTRLKIQTDSTSTRLALTINKRNKQNYR